MFRITDKCIGSLFNRHTEIFEVVGNASFSTPPLMDFLKSSLWSYCCFYGHSRSKRVLVGAVGNPESPEGFQSGLLESSSLRSDSKGAVGGLWKACESSSKLSTRIPWRRHPRQLPQDSLAFSIGGRKVIRTNGLS